MANQQTQKPQMRNIFSLLRPCFSIDQELLRYYFESCTFVQVESMAKSGSEVATNFVPILHISQLYPNFVYSQYSAPRAHFYIKVCVTAQKMREGPSEPVCRSRLQTT